MGRPPPRRTVQCKTIDGITLEAWLWEEDGPAAMIIVSHGINVVSFAESLLSVDAKRIIVWGISFGASVSACCAAVDRCPIVVLMVCPIFKIIRPDRRKSIFAQLIRDRQSQLRGNEPFTLPPYNSKGENPAGYAGSGTPGGLQAYTLMKMAAESGNPNFRDCITLLTFHKLALFRPRDLLEELLATPTMMIIPENDQLSPPEDQKAAYKVFKAPKRLYWATGAGHMDVLSGPGHADVMKATLGFFDAVEQGEII